ncbi:MAG TPA: GH1 family beta-glucosidase [Marmoricola sp.]|nr:GH1 family beta-glucosidase [Marmoricola sp.]
MNDTRQFPEGFAWGVATAAYQIEGAVDEDGRAPSIWDTFSHTPGRIDHDDTGDRACDHYHRWSEDLDLLARLGIPGYRFSTSWARVMPDGRTVNQAGLDFYSRLVDGCLERGIRPMLTLYHWDLPQALNDGPRAGWLDRDVADRFVDYAVAVGKELGDRLPVVTTLNEPWCSAYLGYATGEHAPGRTENALAYRAAHHLNLAHGRAVAALRSTLPATAELSVTLNVQQVEPATGSEADVAATRHADLIANRIFLDPMLRGSYPDELVATTAHLTDWAFVQDGDETEIRQPIDFLGINYYNPARISAGSGDSGFPGTDRASTVDIPGPHTVMDWPIVPSGLGALLQRLHREYAVPLVVTENGMAARDVVDGDGRVRDEDRIDYLRGHLGAVLDAIGSGADVRGYYLWTLLDNFEWAWGYDKRFGIVHVDFDTQARTVKDSGRWYADVVARNALT